MLSINKSASRQEIKIISIEDLVPKDHLVRALDKAIDLDFIYEEVKELYSEDKGRPSVDPVVLFKIIILQYVFGIRSMRQVIREIEVNMAYRWYLGYGLDETVPHYSTFGKNYIRRFKDSDIFERIFEEILAEAVRSGFVDASAVFIDGTHIKANANKKKSINEVVKIEAKHYQEELIEEVEKDRKNKGKKPLKKKM